MPRLKETKKNTLPQELILPIRGPVDPLSNKLAYSFAKTIRAELGISLDDMSQFFESSFEGYNPLAEAVLMEMRVKQEIALVAERYKLAAQIMDTATAFECLARFSYICAQSYDSMQVLLKAGCNYEDDIIEVAQYVCATAVQFAAHEFTARVCKTERIEGITSPETPSFILEFSALFNPVFLMKD